MVTPSYSVPLTAEFLKANPHLLLDTRFFDDNFNTKLLASIDNVDDQSDGLIINSENFQALELLQKKYQEQVKCIYIDPPYNTAATEILYKNEYKHSSWCTLLFDRMNIAKDFLIRSGVFEVAIDDVEFHRLEGVTRAVFPRFILDRRQGMDYKGSPAIEGFSGETSAIARSVEAKHMAELTTSFDCIRQSLLVCEYLVGWGKWLTRDSRPRYSL